MSSDGTGAGADRGAPREAIMEATERALREHGYADLTIQRIADEFEKSKSLIYYHYDTKDDLLVDFLEYLLERYLAEIEATGGASPADVDALIDTLLPPDPDEDRLGLWAAMLELRAQAPHDPAVREQFRVADERLREAVADHVRAGIEAGVYRDVDPERTAEFVRAAANGALLRSATLLDPDLTPARTALREYLGGLGAEPERPDREAPDE